MACLVDMKLFKDDEVYYDLSNIKATLEKEEDYEILSFEIENINNTYEIYDNGCVLYRENNEFEFKLDTIKKESTYLLKEVDSMFDITVEKCEFKKIDEKIIIKYQLETDDYLNKIEITKGGNI